ncbi:hypothetical protein V8E54_001676 [Elaphomyces granulatus]|jgi:hypothetical protein
MSYHKNEARYSHAANSVDIQPDGNITLPNISFRIDEHVDVEKIQSSLPPGVLLEGQAKTDMELCRFTNDVYKFVATYIIVTLKRAKSNLQRLSKQLLFGSQANTTPSILTMSISEEQKIVIASVVEAVDSQISYYHCMENIKPLLPSFEKALDLYNKI